MKKRILAVILSIGMAVSFLGGCTRHATKKPTSEVVDVAETEKYALILNGSNNQYEKLIAQGFESVMKEANKDYVVKTPRDSRAQDQEEFVKQLTWEKVSCIAVAPLDAAALEKPLRAAMDAGIDVCAYDTPTTPDSRELFINQTDTDQIAVTLMDAVLDLSGGMGQWAILSSSSTAANQNEWINRMRETMKDDKYKGLEMVEVAYGDDQYQRVYDQTKALLQNYPDLKTICVPSTAELPAAAAAVEDARSHVKLTGFGLPSEMADHIGANKAVPYMYLWNPDDLGRLTAYVSVALHNGKITGELGEKFKAGDMGEFEVTRSEDEGTQVIVGSPYKFDQDNIERWKDIF